MGLEPLEARLVLSTSHWSGAGATTNPKWSNAVNWTENAAPVAGNDLVFPTGVTGAGLTNSNDLAANTSFNSISIQNSGYTISGNAVSLVGAVDASQTSSSSTLGLAINWGTNPASVKVDNAAATLVMSGVVSGSAGLTKTGSGVLDLEATNTYTGTTAINGGVVDIDGTVVGDVTPGPDTTLGGKGTVGSITATGATILPGGPNLGVLTDNGPLTLDQGSFFAPTVNGGTAGTGYSQLQVGGAITLNNPTLNVALSPSFTPADGQQFTVINNTGTGAITGTFAGLGEGATVTISGRQFTISYLGGTNGNSVVLTYVSVASATWQGGGTTTNWSEDANWQNNQGPSTGEDVVFPSTATGFQSANDESGLALTSILVQDSGYTITGNPVTLSGGIDASQGSGSSTVGLPVTFSNAGVVTVDNALSTLVLGGTIIAASGLVKQGPGVLDLTAGSGNLGATVDGGTLLVDNNGGSGGMIGAVAANPSTTLGGTGTVASIVAAGATVSPGDSATSTGILTDTGPVTLDSHSTFVVPITGGTAGTGYSQLQAGGAINLGGATLAATVAPTFTPTAGQQFTLIDNTSTGTSPITGTFAGLAEGAILTLSGNQFSISYQGGANHNSVVLTALTPTKTTVSPVTTSPVFGQSVTLTATVAPNPGTGTPTGTVQFMNGTTAVGSPVTLNSSGVATLDTTKLNTGNNAITAVYSGDTTYSGSTSPAVVVTVVQASSQATVVPTPNPSVAGQNVTLTATISAVGPGSGTPTGSVTFFNGTTSLGTSTVFGGVATLNTTKLPVGPNSITASYSGDANFKGSTSAAVSQVVSSGATSIQLTASTTNPFGFQPVTFTAIVSVGSGSGKPTGTVTFYDIQGTNLGSSNLTNNQATLTVSTLPRGPESITAVYSGNSSFVGATSTPLVMVVGSPSELFVNQVYLDALAQESGYGANAWIAMINGGYPPKVVSTYILKSRQARVQAVDAAYEQLLGRPATAGEIARALATGTERSTHLYARIFGSKEFYKTRGGGTVDGFLNALANAWFGNPFKPATQARLARQIHRGVSRYKVSLGVISGPSGAKAEVNSIFKGILQRPATAAEQAQYAPLVRKGDIVGLYATLFASPEFKAKFVSI